MRLKFLFKDISKKAEKLFFPILFVVMVISASFQHPSVSAKASDILADVGILNHKILHDGSKTGERVSYQSYCEPEKGFVIYENEKMPFKTKEGQDVLWTKGDIDCYNNKILSVSYPPNSPSPVPQKTKQKVAGVKTTNSTQKVESDPVINCKFQHLGEQKLKQSECSKSFECQIKGQWYIYTDQSKCDKDQEAAYSNDYVHSTSNYQYAPIPPLSTYYQDPDTIIHDCEIDGKIVGQMTSPECKLLIDQYYQERMPIVTDNRNQRINDCLAKFRGLGTLNSSEAQKCYLID